MIDEANSQKLANPPQTPQEARRRKGPVPVVGILLAVCLVLAGLAFLFPAFTGG
jgi:hypothetical protein